MRDPDRAAFDTPARLALVHFRIISGVDRPSWKAAVPASSLFIHRLSFSLWHSKKKRTTSENMISYSRRLLERPIPFDADFLAEA